MRVNKNFGGKRQGYKGPPKESMGNKALRWSFGWPGTIASVLAGLTKYGMGGKHGGRVTPKGIGIAKRGFGRAMRKRK
jgi:hypothetical protein